ncbi:MAG: helix-turn-helix domain-containing protein, partial [Deltaproteobacteria bacterium]|nr:helix-turn-helix domain-containing protein [Deltaproteobacteria bacterium]
MKKNDEEALAFTAYLRSEIVKLGFGSQAKLAVKSGVSKTMISDILSNRTKGRPLTRKKITMALGHSYEDAVALGRKILSTKMANEAVIEGKSFNLGQVEIPSVIYLLAENRDLRMKLEEKERLLNEALNPHQEELEESQALEPQT